MTHTAQLSKIPTLQGPEGFSDCSEQKNNRKQTFGGFRTDKPQDEVMEAQKEPNSAG
jgi:hypothetical protein